ncbi:hypothetical protein GQR58_007170 [Nymphon striatum]|nr:hypothetical protein GQR58_007170 [Nymphon striatum]
MALDSDEAYVKACKTLDSRFGDPFFIVQAYRDQIEQWPKVTDGIIGLQRYADFLYNANVTMKGVPYLDILNDPKENRLMVQKLPSYLSWKRKVDESLYGGDVRDSDEIYNANNNNNVFPSFNVFRKRRTVYKVSSSCETFEAAEDIQQAAQKLQDEPILAKISGVGLLAKEAKYHYSCKRCFLADSNTRDLMDRLVVLAVKRDLHLKHVLKYSLTSVPLTMSNSDGTLAKTDKSKLLDLLQKKLTIVDMEINKPERIDAYIIDGQFLLYVLPPNLPPTYGLSLDAFSYRP